MSGKRYSPEEVVRDLRKADVLLGQGMKVPEVVRHLGVNKVTYYRWRKEFGGMKTDQAKRLKELVADLSLDNAILKKLSATALSWRLGPFGMADPSVCGSSWHLCRYLPQAKLRVLRRAGVVRAQGRPIMKGGG